MNAMHLVEYRFTLIATIRLVKMIWTFFWRGLLKLLKIFEICFRNHFFFSFFFQISIFFNSIKFKVNVKVHECSMEFSYFNIQLNIYFYHESWYILSVSIYLRLIFKFYFQFFFFLLLLFQLIFSIFEI